MGDPILWGAAAFLLNYVPILGPMIGLVTFTFAGLLTLDALSRALLPAALYLIVHLVEGETVTPILLARRFTLDPILVIIALIVWGVPDAILAVPMLAITKIVCDRIRMLAAFGHFLDRQAIHSSSLASMPRSCTVAAPYVCCVNQMT